MIVTWEVRDLHSGIRAQEPNGEQWILSALYGAREVPDDRRWALVSLRDGAAICALVTREVLAAYMTEKRMVPAGIHTLLGWTE